MDTVKHWRMATGAAVAALVLLAVLPPRDVRTAAFAHGDRESWATRGHRGTIDRAVHGLRGRMREEASARAYHSQLRAGNTVSSTRYHLSIIAQRPIPRDSLGVWLRAAEAEIDALGGEGRPTTGHIVLVLHRPDSSLWWSNSFVAGHGPDRLCVVELDPRSRSWDRRHLVVEPSGRVMTRVLDNCGLVSAFGWPAPALERWLMGEMNRWWYRGGLVDRMREARSRSDPVTLTPDQLHDWDVGGNLGVVACVHGSETACRRAVGLEFGGQPRNRWPRADNWWVKGALVPHLLTDTSGTRFRALWTSDRTDPAEAIEAAYGVSAGQLAMDLVRRRVRANGWEHRPSGRVMAATGGWIVVLVGMALLAARLRDGRR